ncbi:hypothetical protein C7M84_003669 [Penaeus vannamei]|uniref:Uncharacterized protein n=1 Tax=Penaeus vannamei TaxID=6689 RepID=A0A3R7SVT0_PENVA|nr:hypothetical protein C7M84_003669 [Penaeus vannamei]
MFYVHCPGARVNRPCPFPATCNASLGSAARPCTRGSSIAWEIDQTRSGIRAQTSNPTYVRAGKEKKGEFKRAAGASSAPSLPGRTISYASPSVCFTICPITSSPTGLCFLLIPSFLSVDLRLSHNLAARLLS